MSYDIADQLLEAIEAAGVTPEQVIEALRHEFTGRDVVLAINCTHDDARSYNRNSGDQHVEWCPACGSLRRLANLPGARWGAWKGPHIDPDPPSQAPAGGTEPAKPPAPRDYK